MKDLIKTLLNRAGWNLVRRSDRSDLLVQGLLTPLQYMLWRHLKNPRNLSFVQIGANDGVSRDPIHELILKYGWRGVCVEPIPEVYEQLRQNYSAHPQVRTVQAAISTANGFATMYTLDNDVLKDRPAEANAAVTSFSREHLLKFEKDVPNVAQAIKEIQVPTVTLGKLLEDHQISSLDVLQIDTDGFDAEVVRMIDFTKIKPRLINFEFHHLSQADLNDCLALLISHGYGISMDRVDVCAALLQRDGESSLLLT